MSKRYPVPGTNAERILHFIISNPGTTTNGVITAMKMNASPVRKCLVALEAKGLIEDQPDEDGNHHYSVKALVP